MFKHELCSKTKPNLSSGLSNSNLKSSKFALSTTEENKSLLAFLATSRAAILSLCCRSSSRITVQSALSLAYFTCQSATHVNRHRTALTSASHSHTLICLCESVSVRPDPTLPRLWCTSFEVIYDVRSLLNCASDDYISQPIILEVVQSIPHCCCPCASLLLS